VSASVGEQIADLYSQVAVKQQVNKPLDRWGPAFEATTRIDAFLARPPDDALSDRDLITNLLISEFDAGSLKGPADVDAIVASWVRQRQELGTPTTTRQLAPPEPSAQAPALFHNSGGGQGNG
jgi:hypothetical protein